MLRQSVALGALVTGLSVLGCGDGTSPVVEPVASVTISGAPSVVMPVGAVVQLIATARDAQGNALNRTIVWSSSDASVATVSTSGLVKAVGSGPVTIKATVEGKEAGAVLEFHVLEGSMGPGGGTLSLYGGSVTLTVPADALTETITIFARPTTSPPSDPRHVVGTAWHLGQDNTFFRHAAVLSLRYEPARLPTGVPEAMLQVYRLEGTTWRVVQGSYSDPSMPRVVAEIWESGTYAIIGTRPDRIQLAGGLIDGAVYVGESTQLNALVFAANGDTLPSRSVVWSSSDPASMGVDQSGRVSGVSAGAATVTATLEAKSASTAMATLVRPVAAWNHTGDWTTSQGGPSRTGYVAATLDPLIFSELWQKSLGQDIPLNPPSAGGGKVFVSQGFAFANQTRLFALEANSGNQLWNQSFGTIHSVQPPAYGEGRVFVATGAGPDSFLWAFDAGTGALQFQSPYENQSRRWLAPAVVDGVVYMGGGYFGGMYAFTAADGEKRWFVDGYHHEEWAPAVRDGRVYAYTGPDDARLSVVDAATGTELFRIPDPDYQMAGATNSPMLGSRNNALITQNGRLLSFDLSSQSIGWVRQASFTPNVALAAERILVQNGQDVEARNESDGALIWAWRSPWGHPRWNMVVTDNLLFVSTTPNGDGFHARTFAVDLLSGKHVWSLAAGGHLALNAQGILLIAQRNGSVVAVAVR